MRTISAAELAEMAARGAQVIDLTPAPVEAPTPTVQVSVPPVDISHIEGLIQQLMAALSARQEANAPAVINLSPAMLDRLEAILIAARPQDEPKPRPVGICNVERERDERTGVPLVTGFDFKYAEDE